MSAADAARPIRRLWTRKGPALFSYGFRPFFLAGALYSGVAVPAWLGFYFGEAPSPGLLSPRDWHAHEMLYGYLAAVVAGFLLTAIPNWTGRLPLRGPALAGLAGLWLAGRLAIWGSAHIGALPAALIDLAFLVALAGACLREIIAGRNWRNLKVLALIGLLIAGNVVFHVETVGGGVSEFAPRIGVGAAALLISLIGGRIVPSFTRNWLARQKPGRLPAPMGGFDMATIGLSALALALWVGWPETAATGACLLAAGVAQAARLARWAGWRTFGERLVLILHVGYAFLPLGFLLLGLTAFGIVASTAGLHALGGGAVGVMTLAVMTRATLGHTGRALTATPATQAIYAAAIIAALARICASLEPEHAVWLLYLAGFAWAVAFLGFAAIYGPMLVRRRAGEAG